MEPTLALSGLYLYLVRNGFPLSVRDYQDALIALRKEYGLHRRARLLWLLRTLWARSEQEVSRLERLFRELPEPTAEDIRLLSGSRGSPGPRHPQAAHEPTRSTSAEALEDGEKAPTVQFLEPGESGIGLPRAQLPAIVRESYIFSPRPPVNLRALIVAWRRFRRTQRSGPRVEVDIEATIAEQCRRGTLVEPTLLPARRNQARLVVLVDASPSMVTWRPLNRLLRESLDRSQLAHTALYFFDNSPGEGLFELDSLTRPLTVETALERHPRCALLVLGDAGAVRRRLNPARVAGARLFVTSVRHVWHPIALLNPAPARRWADSSAARIAQVSGLAMFHLSEDGLTQAIDYLRGKRSG